MQGMPRLTSIASQPEEVSAAIDVIGSRVRTEILRRLSLEPMSAPHLGDDLGINRSIVSRHMVALEGLGLVRADRPVGERQGVTVRWSTDRERVAELGTSWTAYARGE